MNNYFGKQYVTRFFYFYQKQKLSLDFISKHSKHSLHCYLRLILKIVLRLVCSSHLIYYNSRKNFQSSFNRHLSLIIYLTISIFFLLLSPVASYLYHYIPNFQEILPSSSDFPSHIRTQAYLNTETNSKPFPPNSNTFFYLFSNLKFLNQT